MASRHRVQMARESTFSSSIMDEANRLDDDDDSIAGR